MTEQPISPDGIDGVSSGAPDANARHVVQQGHGVPYLARVARRVFAIPSTQAQAHVFDDKAHCEKKVWRT